MWLLRGRESVRRISLPLMGIENLCGCYVAERVRRISLPLMGIENQRRFERDKLMVDELITPHGDRKLVRTRRYDLELRRLITPHGDRKPLAHAHDIRCRADSLPLMGIENHALGYPGLHVVGRLITPHGDRKPDMGNPRNS